LFAKVPFVAILIELNRWLLLGKDMAMAQKDSDLQRIEELIEIMKDNDLVEVEIKHGDDKIFLKRSGRTLTEDVDKIRELTEREKEEARRIADIRLRGLGEEYSTQPQQGLVEIKSPLIGTFYATPSPDSKPYVEFGLHVDAQTVVCIIGAMKVMNEIKAGTSGTIAEVLVANGQAVEYGQVLFRVKPD
jgi:acetyl-CoA carboxylase biotin carboxyl carrier protein